MSRDVIFICDKCGSIYPKWMGRCSSCGSWNSLVESLVSTGKQKFQTRSQKISSKPQNLSEISVNKFNRIQTGILEFDRVLGKGIVPGSVVLLAGEPGIGKSTLILQVASRIKKSQPILYISGEESIDQIKLRAERLKISSNLLILSETDVDLAIETILSQKPSLVIVDSIQTMISEDLISSPGGVAQVTTCASKLANIVKENNIPIFLIGHVTKEGSIAGPKVLEHLVDTVLYLEGEKYHDLRLLRGIKNRFGATNEVGIFEMTENGLTEVNNPSKALLEQKCNLPGSIVVATIEGTRPFLVEIQALTSTTTFGYPKRTSSGISLNRLQLLIAVLTKRVKLALGNQDVYCNIVGGFKVAEPAIDLGVCLAITSAFSGKKIEEDIVVFGEVGLSGELRPVSKTEQRITEAQKLGFSKILIPETEIKKSGQDDLKNVKLLKAKTILDAIKILNISTLKS